MTKKKSTEKIEQPEDFRAPGRHWGGDFGFDVAYDGSVHLPNGPTDKMRVINDKREVLNLLLKSVTDILKADLISLFKDEREWWLWIAEQTKIDTNQSWTINFKTGRLTLLPRPENKEE